jgi:hypothetical protein
MSCGNAVENLIESRLIRVGDQTAPKVFLQGLMRACGSLPQDPVSLFGNVFDLHTRHGAIVAPIAPKCNLWSPAGRSIFVSDGIAELASVSEEFERIGDPVAAVDATDDAALVYRS